MDYDVVRIGIRNAYRNFDKNDKKFTQGMTDFYREGTHNPSVAGIMMNDYILNSIKETGKLLAEALALPDPHMYDPLLVNTKLHMYDISVGAALRSLEAKDIYRLAASSEEESLVAARKGFVDSFNQKYPKTAEIRKRIIEANRLSMDKVTKKAGWFDKLQYARTNADYRQDYPKTLKVRYMLLADNQIVQDGVTPRVKGWLKRFSYKHLIKGGFSFVK